MINLFFVGILISLVIVFIPTVFTASMLIGISSILICLFILNSAIEKSNERIFLLNIFFLSLLLRTLSSFLLYNLVFIHTGTGLLGDAWSYSENGWKIVDMWVSGVRDIKYIYNYVRHISTSGTLSAFDFWNAMVYFFTGKSPLFITFINSLASSSTAIFIYYIALQLYNEKAARISAVLTAFWPSLFIWSIQDLKEPLSIFLIVVLIWAILQLKTRFRFYLLLIAVLSSVALKELRFVSFFIFYALIFPKIGRAHV